MAISTLTTETGDRIVQETVAGVTGASSLNDTATKIINKELFTTEPTPRGWLYGSGWVHDLVDGRMEAV